VFCLLFADELENPIVAVPVVGLSCLGEQRNIDESAERFFKNFLKFFLAPLFARNQRSRKCSNIEFGALLSLSGERKKGSRRKAYEK
jgi:hypothetical protein